MNLLWNLFRVIFLFLLSAVALAAVLSHHKRIYHAFLKFVAQWKRDVRKKGVFTAIQDREKKRIASIRKNGTISVVIFIILVVLVIVNPFNEPVFPLVERGGNGPQWTPWGEFFARIAAPLFVFIISFMSMMRVFRQFKIQVDQVKEQSKKASMEMAAEQFKNAIDHLGNEKQSVVLGGVHALHNLAMNFPDDYSKQVFEVLCSFIREETRKTLYQKIVLNEPVSSKNTQQVTSLIVIQTIVDKLFRETFDYIDEKTGKTVVLYRNFNANLSGAFLRGVRFWNANLLGADLENVYLQGTDLLSANLQGAVLHGAELREAKLGGADLQKANLWEANLQEAYLEIANLQKAFLYKANLQGANLIEADLQGADLCDANLQGAMLSIANLQGASLWGTNLQGAILSSANLQGAKLYGAKSEGATILDEENRQRLIKQGIITEEDFPPPPPQQPDDEPTPDDPTDSTDTQ